MSHNSREEKTVRCVNLFDLRQGKHNLPSIVDTLRFLTWVTFQVDRLEFLVLREFRFEIAEIGDCVIVRLSRVALGSGGLPCWRVHYRWAHPELLEVMQM